MTTTTTTKILNKAMIKSWGRQHLDKYNFWEEGTAVATRGDKQR